MEQPQLNQALCNFLNNSPTPFHAVANVAQQLEGAGFIRLDEDSAWKLQAAGKYFITRNDSTLIAFQLSSVNPLQHGLLMVGSHTDSPCLKLKPQPELTRLGYVQLGVEVYGGALLGPWFDRDLSIAGRVNYLDSKLALQSCLIDFRKPVAVIPSLAIHLDREVNQKRSINAQTDLPPLIFQQKGEGAVDIRAILAEQIRQQYPQADVKNVLDFELSLYDVNPPALVGLKEEFIASARLDNLLSCYVGLNSLLDSTGDANKLLVLTDHEEVGSATASGASGNFLTSVIARMNEQLSAGTNESLHRLLNRSFFISVDNAHGIHPNFADKHDGKHGPLLNAGPVIKFNANQRYATNSVTSAYFRKVCAEVEVPLQSFVVRSDMGCGSTIGPLIATELGLPTLDIGIPTFAMHSIRELAGSKDTLHLKRALTHFFSSPF
ncbi:MAG: M18 family aminopeptidase [Pseudomonadota bacterium]